MCDFEEILKTECNQQYLTRNFRIKNLDYIERDEAEAQSRTFKCERERNDHMLHYEKVFGNVFERRERKCCAVLIKHCGKVKGEKVIILQMNQQLKIKNISDLSVMYQGNYFVVSVKINFCQRQIKCIDDQDKFQSVKDTENEFTECQTPRKKFQSIGILSVSLHAFMKTF